MNKRGYSTPRLHTHGNVETMTREDNGAAGAGLAAGTYLLAELLNGKSGGASNSAAKQRYPRAFS